MKKKKANKGCSRRTALKFIGMTAAAAGIGCARESGGRTGRKMLILGFDGMDFNIVGSMMAAGGLPNFRRVAESGCFMPLVSSTPPQSPVAWSNFITGMNPGGHGIYDFIARDPKTYMPEFSLSKSEESRHSITIGDHVLPLSGGKVELLRKGKAWWRLLEEKDIPSIIINVPANFPPEKTGQRCISGMGTPDILGTYGTFSFYTTEQVDEAKVQGGNIYHVEVNENTVESELLGPKNTLLKESPDIRLPFRIILDGSYPLAKIVVGDEEILLKEGEWSGWLRVSFPMGPLSDVKGVVRMYLKSARPEFRLYVSPVQIDPEEPSAPICTPKDFSEEVAESIGTPFYTQGIPEETWALNEDRLDEDEFLVQAALVRSERTAVFKLELENFLRMHEGAYFCYFGTTDTGSHMFWCHRDPKHPAHDPALSPRYSTAVEEFYKQMDAIVGHALASLKADERVIIMSDHGFAPFYRAFHLNRWLLDNGYMALADITRDESGEFFENVDWTRTKAYAIGLNGLYINLSGREGQGIVEPSGKEALIQELIKGLKGFRDPRGGERIISEAYDASRIYTGAYAHLAPDIIIGYNSGYRSSWETALGKAPSEIIYDNKKKWSGDHCMDPAFVPGIFFCNSKVDKKSVYIEDIAPSILAYFGVDAPGEMDGKAFFKPGDV